MPKVEVQQNPQNYIPTTSTDWYFESRPIKPNWNKEIKELEMYFNSVDKTNDLIKNSRLFIESHLGSIKANNGNKTFFPALERLQNFKRFCEDYTQVP